jgi:hypothetical protein
LEPKISVTPAEAAKDFGPLNAKDSADAAYVVTNTGGGTLTGSASLSGDEQFQFSGASTYSLAAGEESTVTVHFAPDKAGSFAGTLHFGGNGGSIAVSLMGAGVKADGAFNCAGGQKQRGAGAADLLVALLTVLAIGGARQRRARI